MAAGCLKVGVCKKKEKGRKKWGGQPHVLGDLQDIVVEGDKASGAAREGRSWQV